MTAKQKANQARFKKVVAEAKKLRKKNPKLTQAQAVKQAWAMTYSKKDVSVGATKKKTTKKKSIPKKKSAKKSSSYHKDTKSHNVNIRVMSGVKRKRSIGNLPTYKDKDAAREIELYADNDSQLYFQMKRPILINLGNKYKKGTYSIEKAAKLWRYFIDAALKKYNKEFGSRGDKWFELLNTHDRQLLALEYAQATKDEFDLGNFTN